MTETPTTPKLHDFSRETRPTFPMSKILLAEDRARKDYGHLMELRSSIQENGLWCPIGLNFLTNGTVRLIYGATRFKACLMIPEMMGQIPFVRFENLTPLQEKEAELDENVRRKDLSWTELSENMLQIEELKRSIYGDQTRENPGGWSLKKTADLVGLQAPAVSIQVNLAKKLRSRPDLKARVQNLPMGAAKKVIDQIEESERVERLHTAGLITLTHELVHDNALDFLKRHSDNSVDLVLTDPPFGMDELETQRGDGEGYTTQLKPDDNSTKESVLKLLSGVIPEITRVLKPSCHLYMFFELELLGELKTILTSSGLLIQWPVILWDKNRTTNPFRGYNYPSCYEAILYAYKPPEPRRLSESCSSIIRLASVHSSQKIHVFEKPLELLAGFIKRATNHGDLVCDPFAGSGSTLVAAKQLGRRAVGCEINREHFLKAQSRLLMEVTNETK